MPQINFNIKISPSELEKYYAGTAKVISVVANNGQRLQFPANLMLPYVSHYGISGEFVLDYSSSGKARSLTKVGETPNMSQFNKQV
jgi:predicted flavoprotein YhiN